MFDSFFSQAKEVLMAKTTLPPPKEVLKTLERLSLKDAALYLDIKPQTLHNWIYQGKAPRRFKDHRGRIVFLRTDLDRFIKDRSELREAYR